MSEHEKRLRATLWRLRDVVPKLGETAIQALDALVAEQKVTGLDEAHDYFEEMANGLRRSAANVSTPEKRRDMLKEADWAHWAKHKLRSLRGRKKGKEKTG